MTSRLKGGKNVRSQVVSYIRYTRAKTLSTTIAFWLVDRPRRLRELSLLGLE